MRYVKQKVAIYNSLLPPTASSADECSAAAEIYDCGKKKAPEMTDAIQNNLKTKVAAVPVGVRNNDCCLISPKRIVIN
jgi:hypothetical protein